MLYVIVTARSLLWMLTGLTALLFMLAALLSPEWLVAGKRTVVDFGNETVDYVPSVGVFTKCGKPIRVYGPVCTSLAVRGLATDSEVFPGVWKATAIFVALGLSIMSITVFASIVSSCFQSIFRKSIFTISGSAQALAGICYIIGVMLHPMAWGSTRVQKLCGRDASPFYVDECSIGNGLCYAVLGTLLTLISATLSVWAEKSTSSDKVQDQIYEGNTLICLL